MFLFSTFLNPFGAGLNHNTSIAALLMESRGALTVRKPGDSAMPSTGRQAFLRRCWLSVSSIGRIVRGRRAKELGMPAITGCSLLGAVCIISIE